MGMGHGRSDTSGEGQAMYPGFDWIIYNIYIYIYICIPGSSNAEFLPFGLLVWMKR